jgi:hypothetical protein
LVFEITVHFFCGVHRFSRTPKRCCFAAHLKKSQKLSSCTTGYSSSTFRGNGVNYVAFKETAIRSLFASVHSYAQSANLNFARNASG